MIAISRHLSQAIVTTIAIDRPLAEPIVSTIPIDRPFPLAIVISIDEHNDDRKPIVGDDSYRWAPFSKHRSQPIVSAKS